MEIKILSGFFCALLIPVAPLLHAQNATPPPATQASPPPAPPVIAPGDLQVVRAQALVPFLPAPPQGWSADKPDTAASVSEGFPITTVGCVYVKGQADDAPTATINIIDSANNQQFSDATKAMWSVTSNTPQGYDKTVSIDGLPGFEHYSNTDHTGVLWVVVGGRFFVQVETTRLPASELEAWLARIDLKKLAALR